MVPTVVAFTVVRVNQVFCFVICYYYYLVCVPKMHADKDMGHDLREFQK